MQAMDVLELLERLQSAKLDVEWTRCVRARNRNAACDRCARACPSGCISLNEGVLAVDYELCRGCGACATACPTGALSPCDPDDAALYHRSAAVLDRTGGLVTFVERGLCDRGAGLIDEKKIVPVENLGRIDESLLLGLAARGAREIVLVHGAEKDSEDAGLATARDVVATAARLLETWGGVARVSVSRRLPGAVRVQGKPDFDASKRSMLKELARGTRKATEVAVEQGIERANGPANGDSAPLAKVGDDGMLPRMTPPRRTRLMKALAYLGPCADELIETRLWGNAMIDASSCSGCRMCAVFCPTGALALSKGASEEVIAHQPARCVRCGLCEDVCPTGALSLSDEVFARDLVSQRTEIIPMPGPTPARSDPHSIERKMRSLLGTDQVYER